MYGTPHLSYVVISWEDCALLYKDGASLIKINNKK